MVHNAIEYGTLQVLGEGLSLLKDAKPELDLVAITDLWNHGSVIRSWLMELAHKALSDDSFEEIADKVGGGETGTWAVQHALGRKIPIPLIQSALSERFRSNLDENFSLKIIAALRKEFGGHETPTKE